jgi:hypothetical protein
MRVHVLFARRLLAVALVATVAGGLAACGDSDDGEGGSASTAPATSDTATDGARAGEPAPDRAAEGPGGRPEGDGRKPPASGDADARAGDGGVSAGAAPGSAEDEREAVAQAVTAMYRDFAAGDAAGVCAVMSERARGEIAQQVPGGSTVAPEDRTCAQSLDKFLDAAASSGILEQASRVIVKDVTIDGSVATATVEINGRPGDVRLVHEAGEWRFGGPPKVSG